MGANSSCVIEKLLQLPSLDLFLCLCNSHLLKVGQLIFKLFNRVFIVDLPCFVRKDPRSIKVGRYRVKLILQIRNVKFMLVHHKMHHLLAVGLLIDRLGRGGNSLLRFGVAP